MLICISKLLKTSSEIYFKSLVRISRYSVSFAEPKAMLRNWLNSLSLFLPQPSLMFVGTEDEALRIWLVKPYVSSFEKLAVIL